MKLLIANGHLIDPAAPENTGMSVLIEDGRVSAWLRPGEAIPEDTEIFDAGGMLVAPGFIDMHVHLREPGQEHKETIASGCAAAVAGGWTSVCPMPNTNPVNDNAAITRYMIEQAERAGLANVFPIGAITKSSDGTELAEMGEMKSAGAVAVSDDGRPVPNAGIMRRAMQYAKDFDLPVIDHCEDKSLSSGGVMHEGRMSLLLGLKGMPALAEDIDVVRDIILAKETGAHIHIAHVSTKGAVEAVRRAKNEGISVTCEVTPHHFTLTDKSVEGYDTNTKMAPPLRSEEHLEAILEGLKDGTIDAIATDHAPHHADEKALEYDRAPFGITGLETAIGLAFNELVNKGIIDLARLVELCSSNPARIFRLKDRGTLKPGSIADVTIIDPNNTWVYRNADSRSKSKNSPFDGWEFHGGAVATIVGGKVFTADPGRLVSEGKPMKTFLLAIVLSLAFSAGAYTQNKSVYTSTKTSACRTIEATDDGTGSYIGECAGVGGYKVQLLEGDIRQTLNVITPAKKKFELNFWGFYGSFSSIGEKIEWRTKGGVPVALIARFSVADPAGSRKSTSLLMISKIERNSACVTDIVYPGEKQNEAARSLADTAALRACKIPE